MSIPERLICWYRLNGRDLPWRHTRDPYRIWVSEIILQQTRVDQGIPYYTKFIETFPDPASLATAEEQEVLKAWQGLGYYRRALHMHAAAKEIVFKHQGIFPSDYQDIRLLKGIGNYTAAAIGSIAFGLPFPVVDGNVIRMIARLTGIEEPVSRPAVVRSILSVAESWITNMDPGEFNQAMMDFGAMVCKPVSPGCPSCPFAEDCSANISGRVHLIPVRKPRPPVRVRYLNYYVLTGEFDGQKQIYLRKRPGNDIWRNLYDFPCIESVSESGASDADPFFESHRLPFPQQAFAGITGPVQHMLTHQRLSVRFLSFDLTDLPDLHYFRVPVGDLHRYPVPRLIERYISGRSFG